MFALVDCNNFYVSCERVFNPKLRNKPVAVLSNNDGCIVARSNEVRALGIPMGAPIFEYKQEILRHDIITLSSNFALYGDMSARVVQTLETFDFPIEVYSIDEAFIHLPKLSEAALIDLCTSMREKVLQWTGIPVSIGIAPTKTLAKVASKLAKKGSGVTAIIDDQEKEAILRKFPVGDVWGIGRAHNQFFLRKNISNAWELINANDTLLKKQLNALGMRTILELLGKPCIEESSVPETKKSILCSRSYPEPITTQEALEEKICSYIARAAEKLRKQKSAVTLVSVFVSSNRFKTPFYSNSACYKLPVATNYTPALIQIGKTLLEEIYRGDYDYKRAGVYFADLKDENSEQLDFFQRKGDSPQKRDLMKVVDQINKKKGKNTLFFAAQREKKNRALPSQNQSDPYTTSWDGLLKVKT